MLFRSSPAAGWLVIAMSALAGGMGWGIRGQYGHQTGAMLAGLLVGLVITRLVLPHTSSWFGARAVAYCVLGISLGGAMTYGQTLGLTQGPQLIGNWDALRWGLLGLFIKGGVWIGLAGAFLGLALTTIRYRPVELALLMFTSILIAGLGRELLNEPFEPAERLLPYVYFSADWFWEPDAELTPRRECWGSLLGALLSIMLYTRWIRGDRLVWRLAWWGVAAGGIGFASGQCVQAFHAWNQTWFQTGWIAAFDPTINWWNMMEITFGTLFGGILAAGILRNRHLIASGDAPPEFELSTAQEMLLATVHIAAIIAWDFAAFGALEQLADLSLAMIFIPTVACAAGRCWPYLVVLPIVAVPIAGKTLRQLSYQTEQYSVLTGWIVFLLLPVLVTGVCAYFFARASSRQTAGEFSGKCLLLVTWMYFGLNFAFFEFPWPWEAWTSRTPSGLIFTVCALALTWCCLGPRRQSSEAIDPIAG